MTKSEEQKRRNYEKVAQMYTKMLQRGDTRHEQYMLKILKNMENGQLGAMH
jgi:hypothetical protein